MRMEERGRGLSRFADRRERFGNSLACLGWTSLLRGHEFLKVPEVLEVTGVGGGLLVIAELLTGAPAHVHDVAVGEAEVAAFPVAVRGEVQPRTFRISFEPEGAVFDAILVFIDEDIDIG